MNRCFLLAVASLFSFSLAAQSFVVYPEVGHSYNFPQQASGYAMSLNVLYKISPNSTVGFELGHIFSDSHRLLPKDFASQAYLLRDDGYFYNNLASTFPRPNRYFNFNLALKQLTTILERERHSFCAGGGVLLSFRDEMEIGRVIHMNGPDGPADLWTRDSYYMLVMKHDSYLDLGIMGEAAYRYALSERLFLQGSAKLFYYPPSGNWIATATAAFGFSL